MSKKFIQMALPIAAAAEYAFEKVVSFAVKKEKV